MEVTRAIRTRDIQPITARLRADGGFALPTVMLMMLAVFALVSVGVVATVDVQRGTVRDESTKSALQLAETGVNQALLHFNRIKASDTNACSPSGGTAVSGWCQGPTTTDAGGGTYSYQAQVCAYSSTGACPVPDPANGIPPYSIEVVATGTSAQGNAIRRVDVRAHSASGNPMFGDYQVKAGDGITLDSNSKIHAGTATNGDLVLNANAKQCGQASVGPGHQMRTAGSNSYFTDPNCTNPASVVNNQQIDLPPVNPGDDPFPDDGRLFSQDLISGNRANACWNGLKGSGTTGSCGARHLDIGSNTTVTLGGSNYMFCKLTMSSNSSLLVASSPDPTHPRTVNIYFDSPENCGYPSGTAQLNMASNTRISSNDGSPVRLLFVGSTSTPPLQTIINLSSNTDINAACEQNFVVYAPLTDINLNSNSTYCGGLAGKSLHLDSNADVRTNALSQQFTVPNTPAHYRIDRFVDCTATAAGTPPTTGC